MRLDNNEKLFSSAPTAIAMPWPSARSVDGRHTAPPSVSAKTGLRTKTSA